jgi:choline dehydrogenase-like flavoprotein
MLDETDLRTSRCIRCNTCDGFPCLVHAKADAEVLAVSPALEHPNVTLLTNSYVERLETSPSGREVTRVVVSREGVLETYSAGIVVAACGAINSAAFLLRSVGDKHPEGLANRSGVVGRHYMGHVNSVLMAVSKCPNPTIFQKSLFTE